MGWLARLGGVGLVLIVAACAAPRQAPGPAGRDFRADDGGFGRPRDQLFLSPSGKPFRAPAGQPYPSLAWFASSDRNGDARLTPEEFRADALDWFSVLDSDGTGQISMPEVTHWEEKIVPEVTREDIAAGPGGARRPPPRGGDAGSRRQGAAYFSLINEPHPIRGADADFSMSVSQAEWLAAANRRFRLLDLDNDGMVLATDLRPTPVQALFAVQAGRP